MIKKLVLLLSVIVVAQPGAQAPPPFEVHEASIAQIHDAMKGGRLNGYRGPGNKNLGKATLVLGVKYAF